MKSHLYVSKGYGTRTRDFRLKSFVNDGTKKGSSDGSIFLFISSTISPAGERGGVGDVESCTSSARQRHRMAAVHYVESSRETGEERVDPSTSDTSLPSHRVAFGQSANKPAKSSKITHSCKMSYSLKKVPLGVSLQRHNIQVIVRRYNRLYIWALIKCFPWQYNIMRRQRKQSGK